MSQRGTGAKGERVSMQKGKEEDEWREGAESWAQSTARCRCFQRGRKNSTDVNAFAGVMLEEAERILVLECVLLRIKRQGLW